MLETNNNGTSHSTIGSEVSRSICSRLYTRDLNNYFRVSLKQIVMYSKVNWFNIEIPVDVKNSLLTCELRWFRQFRHEAGCTTLNAAAMDAGVLWSFGLLDQIYRSWAAGKKPVGRSQPELTGLLLPFHSDDVIISYDFVRILCVTCLQKLFSFHFQISFEHWFILARNLNEKIIDFFSSRWSRWFRKIKPKIIYDVKNVFFLVQIIRKSRAFNSFNQHIFQKKIIPLLKLVTFQWLVNYLLIFLVLPRLFTLNYF